MTPAGSDLTGLRPPGRCFTSDNAAGAHPEVVAAVAEANCGHAAPYGEDPWSAECAERFTELFARPVEVFLAFGGTGANVVALHSIVSRDSLIVCAADAHIALDEAGAPEHITGAQLVGYPWDANGKLTAHDVDDTASRLARTHIHDAAQTTHVVSVTQATEVGTCYTPAELEAVCRAAHKHSMLVHLDGARLTNAFAAWGGTLAQCCRRLSACGVDVVSFGGTKAGLLGAEAVVFLDPALASHAAQRRKQATQTASKMRFLAAQFNCGLDGDRILAWSAHANEMAAHLASRLLSIEGVQSAYPVETNAVFVTLPAAAAAALERWTPFYMWDPEKQLVRFVTSWDTDLEDVERLVAGVAAACRT